MTVFNHLLKKQDVAFICNFYCLKEFWVYIVIKNKEIEIQHESIKTEIIKGMCVSFFFFLKSTKKESFVILWTFWLSTLCSLEAGSSSAAILGLLWDSQ